MEEIARIERNKRNIWTCFFSRTRPKAWSTGTSRRVAYT